MEGERGERCWIAPWTSQAIGSSTQTAAAAPCEGSASSRSPTPLDQVLCRTVGFPCCLEERWLQKNKTWSSRSPVPLSCARPAVLFSGGVRRRLHTVIGTTACECRGFFSFLDCLHEMVACLCARRKRNQRMRLLECMKASEIAVANSRLCGKAPPEY